ncbi:MAG: YHS domain-containing protein [Verrucomicrobiales bacterium]|nr:YHS domain-containing protein [Verrucomicrobiales bacterium]
MKTFLSVLALSLMASGAALAGKAVNTECPVSGKAVKANCTSEFDGKTVAFCCGKCKAKFDADPSKFADKVK